MPNPGSGNDEERLPWLAPNREAVGRRAAPVAAKRRGAGVLVGGVAALAAALTAGYYIGQRDSAPVAPPVNVALAPVPEAPLAPVSEAPIEPPAPPAPQSSDEERSPSRVEPTPPPATATAAAPRKAAERPVRQRKSAGTQSTRQKQVRAAQVRAAQVRTARARAAQRRATSTASRPPARVWPRMPSPGPAGQVIQLGAFRQPAGANRAYRTRVARYPTLGSMPRVVVPVITKPRGQILYVLRLGTTSRQQSRIVCRNLRASGDHCLVIG